MTTLGKISPISLTTAKRDAFIPDASDLQVIIWHDTLSRLEYWSQLEQAWLPFDNSFPAEYSNVALVPETVIGTSETDVFSITVPAGGFFRVDSRVTMSVTTGPIQTDHEFICKLTDSANTELARAKIRGQRALVAPTELYYYSPLLQTIVDTSSGSKVIKYRAIQTAGNVSVTAVGTFNGVNSRLYYTKVRGAA